MASVTAKGQTTRSVSTASAGKKKKTSTLPGRNNFERETAQFLKRKRCKFKYESERIPYVIAGHYIPDFIVDTVSGRVLIECKGYFRPEDKRKILAVRRCHPNLDIRLLFYASRRVDIRWAERHGIRYAVGEIPTEWLKGL